MKKQPHWLNLTNAAKSCGVSVNTFKGWEVQPIGRDSRSQYFTFKDIESAKEKLRKNIPSDTVKNKNGEIVDYGSELALKTQQERIRLEINHMEKTGELVPANLFMDAVVLISDHWGTSLDSLVLNIKRNVPDIKNSVLEIIEKMRIDLQNELADWELANRNAISNLQKSSINDKED